MAAADPIARARARLLQLKAERDAGRIDERRFEEERRTIEHEIGQGLLGAADAAPPRPGRGLVAVLTLFVVALAAIGYWQTGSPALLREPAPVAALAGVADAPDGGASAPSGLQQIEAMVAKLAERMKERPDDAEGWMMLGRSYAVLRRFAEAVPAYARAAELQPTNPDLLADYADAVAATQGTANNAQSMALLQRALKADPKHPKSLALAGSAAYDRREYAVAIDHWQKIADQLPPGSELAPRVQAMIGDARGHLAGTGDAAGAASAPTTVVPSTPLAAAAPAASAPRMAAVAASASASGSAPAAAGATVSGTVTLDPKIAAQAAPDDAVFVFARAAGGSRMPLAVQRARVRDLPLSFRLDDSMAMAPGMTLSSASRLTVGARISKSGSAIAQPGDLGGEAAGVAPGASNLSIRIDTVVGRP